MNAVFLFSFPNVMPFIFLPCLIVCGPPPQGWRHYSEQGIQFQFSALCIAMEQSGRGNLSPTDFQCRKGVVGSRSSGCVAWATPLGLSALLGCIWSEMRYWPDCWPFSTKLWGWLCDLGNRHRLSSQVTLQTSAGLATVTAEVQDPLKF